MQSLRARRPEIFQGLMFGIPLGFLQIVLIVLGSDHLGIGGVIILGLILYLMVAAIAGFRVSYIRDHSLAGAGAGCITGLTCAIIVTIALFSIFALAANSSAAGNYPLPPSTIQAILSVLTFLLNCVGVVLAVIGGIVGREIGKRNGNDTEA